MSMGYQIRIYNFREGSPKQHVDWYSYKECTLIVYVVPKVTLPHKSSSGDGSFRNSELICNFHFQL